MEINFKDDSIKYVVAIIIIIFVTIVIGTEASALIALIFIACLVTIAVTFIYAQKKGRIQYTNILLTQLRNNYAKKRVHNPKLKQLKEGEKPKKEEKWNIHW